MGSNSFNSLQEERSSFMSRDEEENDDSISAASKGLYSTTITKPVTRSQSPSSTTNKPASFLLSDVVTRGSSSLNQTFRQATQ